MPISPIVLQRRHAELGRIRLGDQVPVGDSGKTRPNKLSKFRFTSVSERYIHDLAALYGGAAQKWDNRGIPSWEVYSEAQSVPVIVVKGGLSQWMETWGKVGDGGVSCVHRCDGERNTLTDSLCDPDDPNHINAKPTTRLSLMLVELEAIGVWRMESHGWNSAAEIPAVAELATFVGDLVPAHLHLVERRSVKDGKTSRFVVPVLDLQIGTERLRQIVEAKVSGGELPPAVQRQVEQTATKQLAAAPGRDFVADAEAARSLDEVKAIYAAAFDAQAGQEVLNTIKAAGDILAAAITGEGPPPSGEDVADAEVVNDGDEDAKATAVWHHILALTGSQGMGLEATKDGFSQFSGGLLPADATAAELQAYADHLTSQAVPA